MFKFASLTPSAWRPGLRKVKSQIEYWSLRLLGFVVSACGSRRGALRGWRFTREAEKVWSSRGHPDDGVSHFVARHSGAQLFSDYGVVIASDRRVLADVSPALGGPVEGHEPLRMARFAKPEKMSGRVAVLSSHAHQSYYHWMFDILPRVGILEEANLGKLPCFVPIERRHQVDSLAALGIREAGVVQPAVRKVLEWDQVFVPSLPGAIGFPTRYAIDFLRERFRPAMSTTMPTRRLYITRSDATTRRVTNEIELMQAALSLGFERISLSELEFDQQIRMFSEAEMVIGPHGAGMTNIVFMRQESCGLLEIMPATYSHDCFEMICSKMNMPYRRIVAPSSGGPENDMNVDVPAFIAALEAQINVGT